MINTETDFRLTEFSVFTKHTERCKMVSWNPFQPKQMYPWCICGECGSSIWWAKVMNTRSQHSGRKESKCKYKIDEIIVNICKGLTYIEEGYSKFLPHFGNPTREGKTMAKFFFNCFFGLTSRRWGEY